MAIDARGHQAPAAGEQPSRSAIDNLSLSVNDVVYAASQAAQATFTAAMTSAGFGASSTNPLVTWRGDAPGLHRIESTKDGTNWVPASGVLHFPTTGARDTWTTTNSALLTNGDQCWVGAVVYQWYGSAWTTARPAFVVNGSNAQTLSSGSWNVLAATWGTPGHNDLGTFSAGVMTVNRPGLYRLSFGFVLTSATTTLAGQITKNSASPDGATCLADSYITASSQALTLTAMADLVANDAIRAMVYCSSANSIDSTGHPNSTQLSIELVQGA